MKPVNHLSVSIITGTLVYISTRAIFPSIACFFTGWIIDIDHIWEFYKNVGTHVSIKNFFRSADVKDIKKSYVFLHSYEILFGLILLCYFIPFNRLLYFSTLGFAIHLILDQIFNPVKPLTYFIVYRMFHGYNTDQLLRKEDMHYKDRDDLPIGD